jgi:hypothetical protein
VEHCTALIEDRNGELRLWEHRQQDLVAASQPAAVRDAA